MKLGFFNFFLGMFLIALSPFAPSMMADGILGFDFWWGWFPIFFLMGVIKMFED